MGVGAFGAGIFHLYTHAFFKACLFLGSGAVIHALHGEQDIRNMGGLRKELPITYWTFLIGAIAIAGVFPLSGFFSKDEILFETFVEGHRLLWTVGALTALLTATYMFRLVFLTFHGARRQDAPAPAHPEEEESAAHHPPSPAASTSALHATADKSAEPAHSHDHGQDHDHGHLHDAPPAMALALIVLAIGSVVAGWIGIPHAIGGHNELGAWLAPSFTVSRAAGTVAAAAAGAEGEASGEVDHTALETTLMAVSLTIAVAGIAFAYFVWVKRRRVADNMAREFPGLHQLLLNKYYVDELYDTTIVQPIKAVSTEGLWRWFDVRVIDGAVNGAAAIVDGSAGVLRRLQSGSVRAYAGSLFVGVVVILGYYLWR
jgi:NADH-quinone oxidoreductase subunit L